MQGTFEFPSATGSESPRPRQLRPNQPERNEFFVDLHIHIGRNGKGRPVKITASSRLTLQAAIRHAWEQKGLDVIGIIDCACTGVLEDVKKMVADGELLELPEGGLRHLDRITLICGAEVEAAEENGGVSHHLCYFPFLRNLSEFSRVMRRYITNMELSSQRATLTARELAAVVQATGGVLIPAHAFTPHKSVYGNAAESCRALFGESFEQIPAIELGLSSDSGLADRLSELRDLTFLSNSDAHSLEKIGREYNLIRMEAPNFRELMLALRRQSGRHVICNYGMNPALGRYHRSYCLKCDRAATGERCPVCGAWERKDFVRGVLDRIEQIADFPEPRHPEHRPDYRYQVPLEFVPGLGARMLKQLIGAFGSEMAVLHHAPKEQLLRLVGYEVASHIVAARAGESRFEAGAGGRYGRVRNEAGEEHQLNLFDLACSP